MAELVDGVLELLAGLPPWLLYLATGLFMVAETSIGVGMVVPGDTVALLAGTTATTPARFAALVAVVALGSLAGETAGYLLGRHYGSRLRASRLGRRVGADRWAGAEAFLNGRGGRAVAAARFVAVVHALLPVVAGTVRMPYRRFISWCAVGAAAWALLYVGAGALAGASWREYGHRLGLTGYLLLAAILLAVPALRAARRRRDGARRARWSRP